MEVERKVDNVPVAKLILVKQPNIQAFSAIIAIMANTKTQAEHDRVCACIEAGKKQLAFEIAKDPTKERTQDLVDRFCAIISKNTGVDCRGITARAFDGTQYSTDDHLYKEVALGE